MTIAEIKQFILQPSHLLDQNSFSYARPISIYQTIFQCFLYGLLLPLSFAPFHFSGLAIISLALFYRKLAQLMSHKISIISKKPVVVTAFWYGMAYGLGFFGLGVSWIFVSIHHYGHCNYIVSIIITLLFLIYLSLFTSLMAILSIYIKTPTYSPLSFLNFAALWTLVEYSRSTFLSGFPWLLIGTSQLDTPARYLLPIIGTYGVSFITAFFSGILAILLEKQTLQKRFGYSISLILLLLSPQLLDQHIIKPNESKTLSVGIIQANRSMRDKWDESLFWQLLGYYQKRANQLLGTHIIVMPESAIPIPTTYLRDILSDLNKVAKQAGSAILLGIPKPTSFDNHLYYNALISLGKSHGFYLKQHLVPFGEYLPKPFQWLNQWLAFPDANLQSPTKQQKLVHIHNIPIATLICYELAYPELLRAQMPSAQFIVSISDNGWFGHSLAPYQQLQLAQALSLQTARYQIFANNDGLSSIIDANGILIASLPAFKAGLLKSTITPLEKLTPWVRFGDKPILYSTFLIVLFSIVGSWRKKQQ